MRRTKRGQSALEVVGKLILVLIVIVIMIFLIMRWTRGADASVTECSGYCSNSCFQQGAGVIWPGGHEWCQVGEFDVGDLPGNTQSYYQGVANVNGVGGVATGKQLGLQCCKLRPNYDL